MIRLAAAAALGKEVDRVPIDRASWPEIEDPLEIYGCGRGEPSVDPSAAEGCGDISVSMRDVCRRIAWVWAVVSIGWSVAPVVSAQGVDDQQIDIETIETLPVDPVRDDFTVRARIVQIVPAEPSRIVWRHGGEGAGGERVKGTFARADAPDGPSPDAEEGLPRAEIDDLLAVGEWSKPMPVRDFMARPGRRLILTLSAGTKGKRVSLSPIRFDGYSTGIEAEFEFRYSGRVVKVVRIRAGDGNVFGLVIPLDLLRGDVRPDSPEFVHRIVGLMEYEIDRREPLEELPWTTWPRPERFLIIDNVRGYGPVSYHGVRYSSRAIVSEILKTLRLLGVNGIRSPATFLRHDIQQRRGIAAEFSRGAVLNGPGYPVPSARHLRANQSAPVGSGCPYDPGIEERTAAAVKGALQRSLETKVDEVWMLTVDEIGAVIDRAPERKGHLAACPLCQKGFREWLAGLGLQPEDFDRTTWAGVTPLNVWDRDGPRPWLDDRGKALMAYYTRRFNCYVSAKMFTSLRGAFAQANARKRAAQNNPAQEDSGVANQPWVYSFALRGCTFLYGGHSLDFFNFYRHADNAFVYETSNRDPRVWSWDSYLSDVGRVVARENDLRQGIYIKPHRGAVVQRALSALSRGMTMLYWYNFGPEYAKGDSYAQKPKELVLTSKAAALIGRTEDVLYGADWVVPAEVGFVSPRSSEIWAQLGALPNGAAAHENAKWSYTALTHAHVPVDPLDEQMLARSDISRYKVLYILGPHLRRDAAAKVAEWVHDGGVLYTSGYGLVRDERNENLEVLAPVLGLRRRGEPEMWIEVKPYRATTVQKFHGMKFRGKEPPGTAALAAGGEYGVEAQPIIGREVLYPTASAEVLARFKDGGAAIVRHSFGKGKVYVIGLWAGLEYSAAVRRDDFDMTTDFDGALRRMIVDPALQSGVRPVVDSSEATIEGVLLRNPKTGKRAVTLVNWAYRVVAQEKRQIRVRGRQRESVKYVRGNAPAANVRVAIRGAGPVAQVKSAMLDTTLSTSRRGDTLIVTVPSLAEGDVLLLD